MKRIGVIASAAAIVATAVYAQALPPAAPASPGTVNQQAVSKSPPPPSLTDNKTGTMYVAESKQDFMSSKLIGNRVVGMDNEAIGEIADLMLSDDGTLRAVVIGVGGVLGVGTHYVAVAPKAVKMRRDPDNSIKVALDATKEQMKAAPEFKYEKRPS